MDVSLFDYHLPPELIAQHPLPERSASRMLVVPRVGDLALRDRAFRDLPEFLRPGDCLVLNDTRVIPARLLGRRPTGGQVEVLLLREVAGEGVENAGRAVAGAGRSVRGSRALDDAHTRASLVRTERRLKPAATTDRPSVWQALVRPGARLRPGAQVIFGDGELRAEVLTMGEGGLRTIRLEHEGPLEPLLDRLGQTPLPPYIKREEPVPADRARYQTVYASHPGAVAAPTAGLHFDAATLQAVRDAGADIAHVTLHVGLGTFQPVTSQTVEGHRMHAEWCEVPGATAEKIAQARLRGDRIIAVGTTVVRTLESRAGGRGGVLAGSGLTSIFISPGYRFQVVDALLTNFHLPRSTLLMLVSAFCGRERILAAYEHAVSQRYRFYSYGDCMFIA